MTFKVTQKILFKHCDSAGMVFYPRYFEIMNDCIEAFFDKALDCPFETLHPFNGVPTVKINTTFCIPNRHGDTIEIALRCLRLGKSSLEISLIAQCLENMHFKSKSTLVYVDGEGRPQLWPENLRKKLQTMITEDA